MQTKSMCAYLEIAAKQSEDLTGKALEILIAKGVLETHAEVQVLVLWLSQQQMVPPACGSVADVKLADYDALLTQRGVAL